MKAQSSLHWMQDGAWLPVYEVRGSSPYCFTGDGLVKGDDKELTMLSSEAFGDGYLEVEIIENKRSGVVRNDGALRFSSEKGWFQFNARVSSDRDIEDAYFVMRFDRFGESSYLCRSLGSLKAGKGKSISIFTQLRYEMPKQLHFYSRTEEIRTSLVPTGYRYEYGDFQLAAK
ncbi:hypothetical protein VDG1235_938 [Verrucomicrobiia bacterium DG1235]|nr:hypothetical protein VDG1235_938 [Verrucomicrobiae bacterium DG1235]